MQGNDMIRFRKIIHLPVMWTRYRGPRAKKDETEGELEGEQRGNSSSWS